MLIEKLKMTLLVVALTGLAALTFYSETIQIGAFLLGADSCRAIQSVLK
jgi:hypothetical protein